MTPAATAVVIKAFFMAFAPLQRARAKRIDLHQYGCAQISPLARVVVGALAVGPYWPIKSECRRAPVSVAVSGKNICSDFEQIKVAAQCWEFQIRGPGGLIPRRQSLEVRADGYAPFVLNGLK
jgi:hypothetical protein